MVLDSTVPWPCPHSFRLPPSHSYCEKLTFSLAKTRTDTHLHLSSSTFTPHLIRSNPHHSSNIPGHLSPPFLLPQTLFRRQYSQQFPHPNSYSPLLSLKLSVSMSYVLPCLFSCFLTNNIVLFIWISATFAMLPFFVIPH